MRFIFKALSAAAIAAGGLGCGSSPTGTSDPAARITGQWVDTSDCGCPAPPVTFTMDLSAQGASVAGSGTWAVLENVYPLAVDGYIEENSVKLTIHFPDGHVVYFRGPLPLANVLTGTWDDPPADLQRITLKKAAD